MAAVGAGGNPPEAPEEIEEAALYCRCDELALQIENHENILRASLTFDSFSVRSRKKQKSPFFACWHQFNSSRERDRPIAERVDESVVALQRLQKEYIDKECARVLAQEDRKKRIRRE